MKKYLSVFILIFTCLLTVLNVHASDTIHSVGLVESTLKGVSSCLHYKIKGMCFWLRCSPLGCYVQTTLKLDHYLPDAVVSAYTKPNNNPWWFAKHIIDPVAYQAGKTEIKHFAHFNMGDGQEHDNSRRDMNNRFHEVDIIGNPALVLFKNNDFLLPSHVTAYKPYYLSLLDAYAWRFLGLERFYPGSLIPGLHEVGTFLLHDWGPVYPRNGYVNQPDDAKAAAVDVLRASTIVNESEQPHLYFSLPHYCSQHCMVDSIKENSKNVLYQMIYPKVEKQCVVFGGSDIASLHPWETDASIKGHDRYVWILWRHYHGCVPNHGAKYLGSINF